jgi:hypothetical protein
MLLNGRTIFSSLVALSMVTSTAWTFPPPRQTHRPSGSAGPRFVQPTPWPVSPGVYVHSPAWTFSPTTGAFVPATTGKGIPLDTAYATFNQEGIKSLDNAVDNDQLSQILGEVQGGPQRIVLCVGDDVAVAVKTASSSFSMPVEPLPAVTTATSDTIWLAVYLGSDGSMPSAYKVWAIEVTGKTIRVAYERDESPGRTCDLRAYLVWAPVGRVEAGVYTLEFFDVVAGNVTASRPWQVITK